MKRMYKIALLLILTGAVILPLSIGQEKKDERRIKIITTDGSGTKTVIDTTLRGDSMPGTITLKNGKVIVLDKPGEDIILKKSAGGKENIIVTVTSDDEGDTGKEEKFVIMSSDSITWTAVPQGSKDHFYIYSVARDSDGKPGKKVIVASAGDKNIEFMGDKVIVMKGGNVIRKGGEKGFSVYVESDDKDANPDATKYVIAKDGIVVTVEGADEAKAKEIVKEIQKKLGIKSEDEVEKGAVKAETKKQNK
jgi:hypothetical protein